MKNKIISLLICLYLSSCIKAKEKDYSYLKIQTQLTDEDKKYYEGIHNQISDIGKVFAFNPEPDETTLNNSCSKLEKISQDLSTRPISRERERVAKLTDICPKTVSKNIAGHWPDLSMNEYIYLIHRLPYITSFWLFLAGTYTKKIWDLEGKEPKKKLSYQKQLNGYFQKSFEADNQDLFPYYYYINANWSIFLREDFFIKPNQVNEEYCQKAVEQRQWDHIYYITKDISANEVISCLDPNDENHKYCNCPEAVKLVIGHWPEEVLENPNFLNPSADPYDGVALRKQLRGAIKKYAK